MRYFEHKKARIEIIPMIDVMLFLLVFFIMVTLSMIPDAGVKLQLPQASTAKALPHPEFTVNVLADGSIRLKDKLVTTDELIKILVDDGDPAKTDLTIASDKTTAFQNFVAVIDAARKAGVQNIGIAAQPK